MTLWYPVINAPFWHDQTYWQNILYPQIQPPACEYEMLRPPASHTFPVCRGRLCLIHRREFTTPIVICVTLQSPSTFPLTCPLPFKPHPLIKPAHLTCEHSYSSSPAISPAWSTSLTLTTLQDCSSPLCKTPQHSPPDWFSVPDFWSW